jgi:nitronate monooxygenase
MLGVTTPEMVAAASKANCLGSLALGDLPADKCAQAIRAVKQQVNAT